MFLSLSTGSLVLILNVSADESMASAIFEWDDENVDHTAQHHVETDEAEAVFDNKPLVLRSQGGKCVAYGQSDEGLPNGCVRQEVRDDSGSHCPRLSRRRK